MLTLLGRHGHRPAHVYFFLTAPGYRTPTTQINIKGDPLSMTMSPSPPPSLPATT